jgi:hypothetical protein
MMGAGPTFIMPLNLTVYRHLKGGEILLGVPDEASGFLNLLVG